jgi:hypothetical protein
MKPSDIKQCMSKLGRVRTWIDDQIKTLAHPYDDGCQCSECTFTRKTKDGLRDVLYMLRKEFSKANGVEGE